MLVNKPVDRDWRATDYPGISSQKRTPVTE
jgi:hypothetical protein